MWYVPVIPASRPKQENYKFKTTLRATARPCVKQTDQKLLPILRHCAFSLVLGDFCLFHMVSFAQLKTNEFILTIVPSTADLVLLHCD